MQNTKTRDTLVGLFVALGIAGLFYMAMQISNLSSFSQQAVYTLIARFDNIGSLKPKSSVTVAGVRIGRVTQIKIDPDSYEAVVEMNIDSRYQLPDDTSASIFTAGLLGEQYIGLEPGGSEDFLKDRDSIDITQSAVVLEELIGQFLLKESEK